MAYNNDVYMGWSEHNWKWRWKRKRMDTYGYKKGIYIYLHIYIYGRYMYIYIYNIDAMLKDWAYREHTEHGKSCERSNAINQVMAGLLVYGMNRSPHYL